MFRRVELIHELSPEEINRHLTTYPQDSDFMPRWKTGIMGQGPTELFDVWSSELNSPRRNINRNCRFFFTEAGWKRFGRRIIGACQALKCRYRVLRIKEKSVDIVYQDEWQVAVRPKRRQA